MLPDLTGKNIALIGGSGFIGHNLALRIKKLGGKVSIVDNLLVNNLYSLHRYPDQNGNAGLYEAMLEERQTLLRKEEIPVIIQDARDYNTLSHVLNGIKPDIIIHLAAVAHANRSNKDPFSTFDHSLRTLENALDNARSPSLNVKQFIFFSSSMIYGHFPKGFVTEDTPCNPLGIYGALKFAGEKMVIAYNQVFGLPYTIVRPSALYGERCISRRVLQIFIENTLQGKPVTISGDGSDALDFTYIDDLCQGIIRSIDNKNAMGQTFNMTYGKSRSLAEVIEALKPLLPEMKVEYQPKDALTPDRGTLSVEKARSLIGYEPAYPIEKGLADYVKWYRGFIK